MNTHEKKRIPKVVKKKEEKPEIRRVADILRTVQGKNTAYASAMLMDDSAIVTVPTTSSGILSLDIILGGGYPYGRLVELYGPPGSGKTTATLHALEATQRRGGVGVFADSEHALDTYYAKRLGVNVPDLLLFQPDTGEDALNFVIDTVPELQPGDLIVVDSVAALIPRVELEGAVGDQHMGLQARMMSQAMRKLQGVVSKAGVVVLFINQTRQKLAITWGNPTTTPGGEALKFTASVRIEVTKTAPIKKGNEVIGSGVRFKTVKNKVYPPFREAETGIRFGRGVPRSLDVLTVASLLGIVEKSGSWLSYAGAQLGQGLDNAADMVESGQPQLLDEIERKVLECYQLNSLGA